MERPLRAVLWVPELYLNCRRRQAGHGRKPYYIASQTAVMAVLQLRDSSSTKRATSTGRPSAAGFVPWVCPDSCGIVFQLSPGAGNQWAEKVIYTFCSHSDCTDGARPASQLIFDSIGNLYGTTQSGGSVAQHTNGTVFELSPTQDGQWSEVVLYAFQGGGDDGENPEGGLAQDANGNLYGATQFGYSAPAGGANNGTVFKLTKGSQGQWTETLIYGFCSQSGCNDGTQPLTGVILDKSGNAYGTTFSGGMFNWGVVFKLMAQNSGLWPESILYAFEGAGDGFNPHAGLTLDSSGNLYGVAFQGGPDGNGVVFKITP